jgi:hypothetical protein
VHRLLRCSARLAYSVIRRAELLANADKDDEPNIRRLLAGKELPVDRRVAD